jgi:hypothetical protein
VDVVGMVFVVVVFCIAISDVVEAGMVVVGVDVVVKLASVVVFVVVVSSIVAAMVVVV